MQELSRENPFSPQYFSSYRHAFKTLASQGLPGFYKGNFLGVLHSLLTTQSRFLFLFPLQQSKWFEKLQSPVAKTAVSRPQSPDFAFLTVLDIAFQPLHNLQSRFILQKQGPNSRAYRSVAHALQRHGYSPAPFYQVSSGDQGAWVCLPMNLIKAATLSLVGMDSAPAFVAQYLVNHLLTYPLLTVQRRLECRSSQISTMLDLPYKSTPP